MIKTRSRKFATEHAEIKKEIMDYLRLRHWYPIPINQGRKSFSGITDIIAIKKGVTIYIEVKAGKDKLRKDQIKFKKNIEDNGGIHIVPYSLEEFINKMEELRL